MSVTIITFALGLYLWMLVYLMLHEGAHFLAGTAVGLTPFAVTLGTGPALFEGRLRKVFVRIRWLPLSGFVQARLRLDGLRWRGSLFSAAGPLLDLILLLILVNLASGASRAAAFFTTLAVYQAVMLAANLIPLDGKLQGVQIANDGKQLLQYLSGAALKALQDYEAAVSRYDPAFRLADSWMMRGDLSHAFEFWSGAQDMAAGRHAAAIETYLRFIGQTEMHPAEKALLLDQMACVPVLHGGKTMLPAAESWARQASALLPACDTVRGTLGSILVEKGDCTEGLALLMPLTSEGNSQVDRTLASCYVAKAFHQLGDAVQARKWIKTARHCGAFPAVVARIEAEFAPG